MSIKRKIKRITQRKKDGRTTCPKCHSKLVEKAGYGKVCAECGWWNRRADNAEEISSCENEKSEKDYYKEQLKRFNIKGY